ncbi:hypothetical protein [Mesorhizobium xinjiangense]|uniref:hypothetical protein n=1 Tax=Mesorhizobium xinjiangense TaxID=2678685 RepID=UPI0012EDAE44|nr:hypothetical protein [Mesorhizobium xinjiangense]
MGTLKHAYNSSPDVLPSKQLTLRYYGNSALRAVTYRTVPAIAVDFDTPNLSVKKSDG